MSDQQRVSLAGFTVFSVGMEVERNEVGVCGTIVRAMLRVGHDATGQRVGPLHLTGSAYRLGAPLDTEALRVLAKEAIMNALSHEVDEWLRVDDKRVVVHVLDTSR